MKQTKEVIAEYNILNDAYSEDKNVKVNVI